MEGKKGGKRYSTERNERLKSGVKHPDSIDAAETTQDAISAEATADSAMPVMTDGDQGANSESKKGQPPDGSGDGETNEEELKVMSEYLMDMKAKCETRMSLKRKHADISSFRPDESAFTKLDSSLKKNTALVRKLKTFTESQKDQILKDIQSLNLTKYISEVATAIVEAKLKMSDIQSALEVCCLLHERYAEFSDMLLENWQKVLLQKKDDKVSNQSKFRVDLRFFAELVAIGILPEKGSLNILSNQLNILINCDKEEHQNISVIQSFCKHCGNDYAGLIPHKYRILLEKYGSTAPSCPALPVEKQKACRNLLKEYYSSISSQLIKNHKELKSTEWQNNRILHTKGELSHERQERYETMLAAYQKLITNVQSLSDLVDEPMCELIDFKFGGDSGDLEFSAAHEFQYDGDTSLYEDEETQHFYENLLDLRAIVPQILLKDQPKEVEPSETPEVKEDANLKVEDIEKELQDEGELDQEEVEAPLTEESETTNEQDADDPLDIATTSKLLLEKFLQDLQHCVNREMIDRAAQDFCMTHNTKGNKKRLARVLFSVPRTRYDLLPFYARLVATLYPCMPEVSTELCQYLTQDFRYLVRKKDQINIETKIKTVRFIGELVKFGMYQKAEALHCLKMLLFDFSHHNIEMACTLMETCGRFLYRSTESHHRTRVYLEIMMKKKNALSLDTRYNTMIENAFYYSNPPSNAKIVREQKPPLHEYIRKLLYKDLNKVTTEKVLRQMRKLNWKDPQLKEYIANSLISVWNMKYGNIHCMANLLAGLAPYHDDVAVHVVDGALEEIRAGMEVNHPKYNQHRVAMVKYVGELYNYRMVDSSVVFKILYSFITFGVSYDHDTPTILDQPGHLFRLRLVCAMLDTCGQYFDRGSSKKKLDYFLVYFQKYFWFKKASPYWSEELPFPVTVDMTVKDCLEALRPKDKLPQSYLSAKANADDLDAEFRQKLAGILPAQEQSGAEDDLPTIAEGDEADESGPSRLSLDQDEEDESSQTMSGTQPDRILSQEEIATTSLSQSGDVKTGPGNDESVGEMDFQMKVNAPKHLTCQEDDDFLAAFDKMVVDNIQTRAQESVKVPQIDISVPVNIKSQLRKPFVTVKGSMIEEKPEAVSPDKPMKFALMTKKGNKPQLAALDLPISQQFATRYREHEAEEKAEKERLKQLVLEINERQEEEEMALIEAGKTPTPNTNREKKVKYNHPKGAPDADLIFGSGPKNFSKR